MRQSTRLLSFPRENVPMRRLVPLAAFVLCGTVVMLAGQAPQAPAAAAPQAAAPAGGPPADWLPPTPKNLKVLPKETDPKQLMEIMRGYNAAMGVRCVYCHVAGPDPNDMSAYNFESDRKEHKEATRAMMKYTDAVNQAFPKEVGDPPKPGESYVTCFTCHQGQRHPPLKPKAAAPGAPAAAAPPRP
jgi:hypothetical protein